jgi:DNA-binding response OmpR family regulator
MDQSQEVSVSTDHDMNALVAPVPTAGEAKRILLLVEDDWRTHSALRKILTRFGWEVHSAMTVSGGLALLHLKPDAIILDMMLPDGDGMEILRQVRASDLTPRIAVTTGIEDRVRLEEIRKYAPDGLLRKPLELQQLLAILGNEAVL